MDWDDLETFDQKIAKRKAPLDAIKIRKNGYIYFGSIFCKKIENYNFVSLGFSKKNNCIVMKLLENNIDFCFAITKFRMGGAQIYCRSFFKNYQISLSDALTKKEFEPVFEEILGRGECLVIYL